MPWLKMLKGETPGRAFPLDQETTVLGRDAACEIVLSDHGVSKRHAKITRKDDGFYIEDLHSTNGTKVANQELTEPRRLDDGDPIEIGDTQFVFSETGSTILGVLDVSSTSERQIAQVRPRGEASRHPGDCQGTRRHHRPGRGTGEGLGGIVPHPSPSRPGIHPPQGRRNRPPDPKSEQVPATGCRLSNLQSDDLQPRYKGGSSHPLRGYRCRRSFRRQLKCQGIADSHDDVRASLGSGTASGRCHSDRHSG